MQKNIPLYKWFVDAVYYMRIHALIFISGYLLGYTVNRKPESLLFKNCVLKKIKRLIVPSIIFSTIYYIIFYDITKPWLTILYSILNGCGHMWFLPMLFWCFVSIYIIEKFKLHSKTLLLFIILATFLSGNYLPFRLSIMFQYFIYFYLGYAIQRGILNKLKPNGSAIKCNLCWIGYIIGVIILVNIDTFFSFISSAQNIEVPGFNILYKLIALKILPLSLSLLGLFGCYWGIHKYIIGNFKVSQTLITYSTYCYGIYICQQFILRYLYYKTDMVMYIDSLYVPIIGICVALFGSLILTKGMLNTKIGRFLLG